MTPTANTLVLSIVCFCFIESSRAANINILPAERCADDSLNFCGGDESKYPIESINNAFNQNEELKSTVLTLRKFFGPEKRQNRGLSQNGHSNEVLDKLACRAIRQKIPTVARAKNVKGKWKYLVQRGKGENDVQEIEIVKCDKNEELHCRTGQFDSPFGKESTKCRQVFTTRKLLAIDENGIIGVDSFSLPSACLCKFITPKINFRKAKPRPSCDASEKLLTQEIISVNDNGKLISSSLKEASEKIVACEGTTEFCTDDSGYPISQIDDLLETNVQQDYFNEVLTGNYEKPACQEKRDKTPGWFLTTETENDDFVDEGDVLCDYKEKQEFPSKAKSLSGKWKYIINTDKYRQIVATQTCRHFSDKRQTKSCTYSGSEGNHPDATECKQLYMNQELLSVSEDGSIEYDNFRFPSICACHIIDESYLN